MPFTSASRRQRRRRSKGDAGSVCVGMLTADGGATCSGFMAAMAAETFRGGPAAAAAAVHAGAPAGVVKLHASETRGEREPAEVHSQLIDGSDGNVDLDGGTGSILSRMACFWICTPASTAVLDGHEL